MIKKSQRSIRKLIPWYLNDSLSSTERDEVASAISQDGLARADLEAWKRIQTAVTSQAQRAPSAFLRQRIMMALHEPPFARGKASQSISMGKLFAGALLTFSVLILLWLVVQPGVVLQWSLERDSMTGYRIYRAAQGSSQFKIIKEIPAQTNQLQYRFIDTFLVPGRNYIYRVEGIRTDGVSSSSQVVSGRALDVLPGQLALILTSVIMGYGIVFLIRKPWPPKQKIIGYFA